MSTTSTNSTILIFHEILEQLYRYGGVILIILGTISSTLNIAVFVRSSIRRYPCVIYFIVRNIFNFIFIFLSLLYITLVLGYNLLPNSSTLNYCHFSIYISLLCDILSPFYLILASIDRLLTTSTNSKLRKKITFQFAWMMTILSGIFWILFHLHALIYSEIVEIKSNQLHCDLKNGLYSTLITYYSLIIKGILCPLILFIFAIKILQNLRHTRRIQPIIIIPNTIDLKQRKSPIKTEHITSILIKDIFIYISFSLLMSTVLLYELITQHHTKNFQQQEIEYFFRHLTIFCVSIPFCIGCYTNLCVSKFFRNEIFKLFSCK